ncbi:MAG: Multidrug resistance protein 3 [Peptostreptococcus russellii]
MSIEKKLIALALFICNSMGAIEITIVTTAIPSIVKDLSGFNLSSYIFSIFLLTSAIATTVFGKLSDIYGKKKLLQIAIVIFLIGSLLCGLSQSMVFLIISRAIQGLGSGALTTLTMAVIGDVFAVEERAMISGYNSTVWSVASLIAPMLGGLILLRFTWHWVFYINIPVGILSMILIQKAYKFEDTTSSDELDIKGLTVMTIFVVCLLQAMSALENHSFFSLNVIGLFAAAMVFLLLFIKVEKGVKSPVLPYQLFSKEILIIMIITFLNSVVLIAMDVYNPSFMQSVQGHSPLMSTVPIVPLSVAWVLSSFFLSRIISKYSTKSILIASLSVLAAGILGLVSLNPESSPLHMGIASGVIGLGFGGSFNMLLFIVQETLSKEDMGMASGSVMFVRTLGQTIGISMFGLVLNNSVIRYFAKSGKVIDTSTLLSNKSISHLDLVSSQFNGYNNIYLACFILSVACVFIALLLPGKKKLDSYN